MSACWVCDQLAWLSAEYDRQGREMRALHGQSRWGCSCKGTNMCPDCDEILEVGMCRLYDREALAEAANTGYHVAHPPTCPLQSVVRRSNR